MTSLFALRSFKNIRGAVVVLKAWHELYHFRGTVMQKHSLLFLIPISVFSVDNLLKRFFLDTPTHGLLRSNTISDLVPLLVRLM